MLQFPLLIMASSGLPINGVLVPCKALSVAHFQVPVSAPQRLISLMLLKGHLATLAVLVCLIWNMGTGGQLTPIRNAAMCHFIESNKEKTLIIHLFLNFFEETEM